MSIELFFDPISPYSFLASLAFDRIEAETGRSIISTPILFAGLLKAHGTKGPAQVPAKRSYVFRDVERTAARLGVELLGPPAHPFVPLLALRACASVDDDRARLRLTTALLEATWSAGRDLTSPETIVAISTACGLDGEAVVARAGSQPVKDALRKNTERALELNVFGVPTFRVGAELFWGADRVNALIDYCGAHLP